MPGRIIDTHVHIWDFSRAEYSWLEGNTTILNRTYPIEELETEIEKSGVTDGILVQAANNKEDTQLMLDVAAEKDWIRGVIGWVPLMHPTQCENALKQTYLGNKFFKGVRHLIHDEVDPKWLLQEKVLESLSILADHQLVYEVVGVKPEHIETALVVAEKIPSLRMVFDHLNQPPIASEESFGRWGVLMEEAAKNKNLYAKISGLGLTANNPNWSADTIKPYVEFVLDHFGIDRCFCGGDWPVSLLAGDYARTWRIYREVIDALVRKDEREKIYSTNAIEFYRI